MNDLNSREHTVTTFDQELKDLNGLILKMGSQVIKQLQDSLLALCNADEAMARLVIKKDKKIDELEDEINKKALEMIALRQPMATDLRIILSSVSISADLERMGDYARNIAKRSIKMEGFHIKNVNKVLFYMAKEVEQMLMESLNAYSDRNLKGIQYVIDNDDEIDELYNGLLRTLLTYMMEDQKNMGKCISLMFMAKRIERAGDLCVHISEKVYSMVKGERFQDKD